MPIPVRLEGPLGSERDARTVRGERAIRSPSMNMGMEVGQCPVRLIAAITELQATDKAETTGTSHCEV